MADVSPQTRQSWLGEIVLREERKKYFTGRIFEDKVPLDTGVEEEYPELYPVGVNLVKMLSTAQADSEFGEWDNSILSFEPDDDTEVQKADKSASQIANDILRNSNVNTMLWEVSLDRNIYGGAPIKIKPDIKNPGWIKWSRVPLESFFPVWDPEDPDNLLEVYIVYKMTREQAKAKYGYDGDQTKEWVTRIDHYTLTHFESKLEGLVIPEYTMKNPWGFIPFEYIPRVRTTHWWGDSLTEDITRVQDELNLRLADLGEAVNYNTHPTRWGINLPRSFNSRNYPVGSNQLWDLGKHFKDQPPPEVGILEAQNPIPRGTFDYVKFLYDWGRTSVMAPPIVFGEEEGGQRSGVTLEIRMWPMIKAVRRSRGYLGGGVKRAMRKSALILRQKRLGSEYAVTRLINQELDPIFPPIMPRDQAKIVDEVVKRMTTVPPTISLETSVKKLGDGTGEVERIKDMLDDDDLYDRAELMAQQQQPGADGATGAETKEPE
jgi:hypothetical protein